VLTLQNLAPFARHEGAAVVVPFADGAVPKLPDLHVPGTPTAWQPFGARWPDGSVRQALCLFETTVAALGEVSITLEAGSGPPLPTGDVALPTARIEFVARQGETTHRAIPERVGDLEHNALRRVELRRARLGDSGLVVEMIVGLARPTTRGDRRRGVLLGSAHAGDAVSLDELAIETTAWRPRCATRTSRRHQATTEQAPLRIAQGNTAATDRIAAHGPSCRRCVQWRRRRRDEQGRASCRCSATSWRDSARSARSATFEPPMAARRARPLRHCGIVFVAGDEPGGVSSASAGTAHKVRRDSPATRATSAS
jgi:hypothetical protein